MSRKLNFQFAEAPVPRQSSAKPLEIALFAFLALASTDAQTASLGATMFQTLHVAALAPHQLSVPTLATATCASQELASTDAPTATAMTFLTCYSEIYS